MRVLVTRPQPDQEPFVGMLRAAGFEPVVCPVLEIRPQAVAATDWTGLQAVLITSANGARALAAATNMRDLRLVCVGPASADAARALGFRDVLAASGEGTRSLADLCVAQLRPDGGPLLHGSGQDVAGDLVAQLRLRGFDARRLVLYRAVWAEALSDGGGVALRGQDPGIATFFSVRSVEGFWRLVAKMGLETPASRWRAACLSQAVAGTARARFGRVGVAAEPSLGAMLEAVRELAQPGV
jgi:uroporphyrinogen-III synthase